MLMPFYFHRALTSTSAVNLAVHRAYYHDNFSLTEEHLVCMPVVDLYLGQLSFLFTADFSIGAVNIRMDNINTFLPNDGLK